MTDNDTTDDKGLDLISVTFEYLELDFEVKHLTDLRQAEDIGPRTLERLGYAVAVCLEHHLGPRFYDYLIDNNVIEEDKDLEELLKGGFGVDHQTPEAGDI